MHGDSKSKRGRIHVRDLGPRSGAIRRPENAIVVLHPQGGGGCRALDDQMRILRVRLVLEFGRHVLRAHSLAPDTPRSAAVASRPGAACGHSDHDVVRVSRVYADGMKTRIFSTTAAPLLTKGIVPQRPIQRP